MSIIVSSKVSSALGTVLEDGIRGRSGLPLAIDPRHGVILFDDFLTAQATGNMEWTVGTAGTSNGPGVTDVEAGELGVSYNGAVGNGGASRGYTYMGVNGFAPHAGKTYVEIKMRFGSLSDVTDPYVGYFGIGDSVGDGDMTDGVYFVYDQATDGDYWRGKTARAGVRTSLVMDGGGGRASAPVTTGAQVLGMIIDGSTSVEFFHNRVSKGTIITNLPNSISTIAGLINKLDKTTGAGSRNYVLDYWYFAHIFTTPR